MGFVFKQDGVDRLVLDMKNTAGVISPGLTSVQEASEFIANKSDWQGNKATSVKDYCGHAHGVIIASLGLLLKDLYDQVMLYSKTYHAIDSDEHAIISEAELTDLKEQLNNVGLMFDSLSEEAASIIRSVSHIKSLSYAGIEDLSTGIGSLIGELDLLCGDINQQETGFQSSFEAERYLINSLKAQIADARGTNLESFSKDSLARSKSYQDLVAAYMTLAEQVQRNASAVEEAEVSFEETYQILQAEYEERKAKAERAKFWVGVATAVVSAVIITATAGAGAALVIGVGAACGAINAGVGSYYDQQIGTVGYPGSVNGWKVAGAALFGGAVGAATSAVSLGFGSLSSSISAQGASAATLMQKADVVLQKAAVEGFKNVTTGVIERAGDACYESISSGQPALDMLSNTLQSAFDGQKMIGDMAGGFAGGLASEGTKFVSGKIEGKLFGNSSTIPAYEKSITVTKTQSPLGQQAFHIAEETVKDTGKGMVKRFTKTLVTDGDIDKALNEAFDGKKILTDAATTMVSETASTATADVKTHLAERTTKAQKQIDNIQKKVNEDAANYNSGNAQICEDRGAKRTELGMPDFQGSDHLAAETTIEQTVTSPDDFASVDSAKQSGRRQDYINAYDKMVAEKKIDPNEYYQNKKTGHVYRRQTMTIDGKTTVVETEYTIHHVEYDVNTNKTRFQLVETSAHQGLHHQGGNAQAYDAYNVYHVDKPIREYNNAVTETNEYLKAHGASVKAGRTGVKSSNKVVKTHEDPNAKNEPFRLTFELNYAFLT